MASFVITRLYAITRTSRGETLVLRNRSANPGPDWDRLDLRGLNSSRNFYGFISPSRALIVSYDGICRNIHVTVDDAVLQMEYIRAELYLEDIGFLVRDTLTFLDTWGS